MLALAPVRREQPIVIVALAAHPDDLEIGCAGTLMQMLPSLIQQPGGCDAHSVVVTGSRERVDEARAAAAEVLGAARARELSALGFTDGLTPGSWQSVKLALRDALDGVRPDWVLAPSRSDSHQDHRLLGELAWQLFRGATIWEYEIPKWEGDLGPQNVYVPLTDLTMHRKVDLLRRHYSSQSEKSWYDEEVFRGLGRLRGVECGANYAEAFSVRKTIVQ